MTYTPTVWADGDCVMAADMNNIETGVDIAQGDVMVLRGLLAALPATDPTLIGRLYFATDTSELFRDNGAGWDQVFFDHGDLIGLADNDHPQYVQDIEYTALGDILVGTGAGTFANLGVGALGEVLTVAGGTATWAASAAGAWTLIQEQILGAPAAAVTFAVIPGTYRALRLHALLRTDHAGPYNTIVWRANADSGNNYDYARDGIQIAVVQARAQTFGYFGGAEGNTAAANNFGSNIATWVGYALADRHKTCISDAGVVQALTSNLDVDRIIFFSSWRNTNAITSLTYLSSTGANFVAGCHFTLYGIT